MKVKVTIEYWGAWSNTTSEDYKVVKIVGAPTVGVSKKIPGNPPTYEGTRIVRVGDIIDEAQATELARNNEVTTVPKSKK